MNSTGLMVHYIGDECATFHRIKDKEYIQNLKEAIMRADEISFIQFGNTVVNFANVKHFKFVEGGE